VTAPLDPATAYRRIADNVQQVIQGKPDLVRLAVVALFADGHLLLEDVPGLGKTSLARSLARSVGGTFSRIQFTPDLLPSDVTGVTIYNQGSAAFEFHEGGIFANVVLADEINRATPKTQSALLEVMAEGNVTVDSVARPVPKPFIVLATQNPIELEGTYRLPEAQLDRFLMRTSLGYPDPDSTVRILRESANRDRSTTVGPLITADAVVDMAALAAEVHADDSILVYISQLATASRQDPDVSLGVSIRGCMAFIRCAKTWAASQGRNYVVPDDVKELALPVLSHRILLDAEAEFAGATVANVLSRVLSSVEPPVGAVA
jgi:MoxR-like ATPase